MAEEIDKRKTVAEVVLDAKQALSDAETLYQKLKEIEQLISQFNESQLNTESLSYIKNTLQDIINKGYKMADVLNMGFSNVSSARKYRNVLEEISLQIDDCRNKLQLLNVSDNIDSGAIDNYSDMLSQLEEQYDKVLIKLKGSKDIQDNQDKLNKTLSSEEVGKSFAGGVNLAITSLRTLNSIFPNTVNGIGDIITQANAAKQAMAAGTSAPMAWGTAIISGIGIVADLISNEIQKAQKAAEEARQKAVEAVSEYSQNSEDLNNLSEKFVSLSSKLDNANLSRQEEIEIKKELYQMQDDFIKKYDLEANAIDFVTGSIKGQTEAIKEQQKTEAAELVSKSGNEYRKYKNEFENKQKYTISDIIKTTDGITDDDLKRIRDELNKELSKIDGVQSEIVAKRFNGQLTGTKELVINVDVEGEKAEETFQNILLEIPNIGDKGIDGFSDKLSNAYTNAYNYYFDNAFTERKNIWESVKKANDILNGTVEDTEETQKSLSETINDIMSNSIDKVEECSNAMSDLSSVYQSVSSGEKLSANTLSELCEKYPELAKYINETGDLTFDNGKKIKEVYNDQKQSLISSLEDEKKELEKQSKAYDGMIFKDEQNQIKDRISEIDAELLIYNNDFIDSTALLDVYKSKMDSLSSAYKTVSEGGELNSETLQSLSKQYPEIAKYIEETGDATLNNGKLLEDAYKSEQDAAKKAIYAEMQKLNILIANGEATDNQKKKYDELRNTISLYTSDILSLQDTVDIYTGKMSDLSSAYKTVSEGGELDANTLQKLCRQYPDLANYISETGDLTLKNGEKIKEAYEKEKKLLAEKLTKKKKELELEKESSANKEKVAKELAQVNAELEICNNLQLEASEQELNWSNISSEVKNLASAYQTLNEGKQLDIDTMISLIDKYPEVAAAMAKEGKLGKDQAEVLKQLAEAKKQDYITTQNVAIKNLEATKEETEVVVKSILKQAQAYLLKGQVMQAAGLLGVAAVKNKDLDNINKEIDKHMAYLKAMENLDIDTYGKSDGGNTDDSNKALANELKQLEHKKAIGQLNSQQEYNWLVRINNKYRKNADEQSDMEKRLYNAKKQMQADEEAANTKALQEAYKGIENKKSLGKMNSQQELRQLEQIRQRYKMTAEERMELEIKIYNLKKSLKDDEISSINTLADAVTEALKQKYEEQRKLEENRINESIESWQNWEDKTVSAIQGEIDALDELAKKQDSENKRQEYENKRQQTELQLAYEKDDYNRTQLQKELARLDKEEAERLAEEQREAKKKALEGRIEAVKGQSQATQERLNKELDKLGEKYEKLTDSFSLKAQAQKFIADSTQKQIVSLIKSYASDYEIAGNTIGDALYNGMKAKMDNISAYVDGVFGKIEAYQRQMANTANASADRFWASQNSAQSAKKQSSQKAVTVKQTVNFNQPIESPVETRRQLDRTNQALAQQISNGI